MTSKLEGMEGVQEKGGKEQGRQGGKWVGRGGGIRGEEGGTKECRTHGSWDRGQVSRYSWKE